MRVAEYIAENLQSLADAYNTAGKTLITPVYNVKGYGAKGDGTTNDTQAVQDAVDDAIASGAKFVWCPPGTYNVTSLTNSDKVVFIGDNAYFTGISNTIFNLPERFVETKSVNGESIIITNPWQKKANTYKGNLHAHTTNSDGTSTPTELMTAYKNAGYDFCAITDHDVYTADPGVSGILFIPGVEESLSEGHIVALNVNQDSTKTILQEVINDVISNGGVCGLAHPDWFDPTSWPDAYFSHGEIETLFGFELIAVYNGHVNQDSSGKLDVALSLGKRCWAYAEDDTHNVDTEVGKGWIVVNANELTLSAILEQIRKGKFYASTGAEITSVTVSENIITVSTPHSSSITWYKMDGIKIKTTTGVTSDTYEVTGDEGYVRAEITRDSDGKKAWIQPLHIFKTSSIEKHKLSDKDHGRLRNVLFNGNFDIWQRDTSFSLTSTAYTADRWRVGISSGSAVTVTREDFTVGQIDVPQEPKYYARVDVTDNTGGVVTFGQRIEDVRTLSGQKATLTFFAKGSNLQGTFRVEVTQYFGSGDPAEISVFSDTITEKVTDQWKKFKYTFFVPSISGRTLATNHFLQVRIHVIGSSSLGTIDIAQVQLEAGDYATPFEIRSLGLEMLLCQRYYEKYLARAINGTLWLAWKATKRTTPTLTASAGTAGNATVDGCTITHTADADVTITADAEIN